jgi:hypothetical protein
MRGAVTVQYMFRLFIPSKTDKLRTIVVNTLYELHLCHASELAESDLPELYSSIKIYWRTESNSRNSVPLPTKLH